jgi:hypothetical protein
MPGAASLKNSNSPQVIIERLAHKKISEEEAERTLEQHWGRAYDTPIIVQLFRAIFHSGMPPRRARK